ncbi:MAG: ABC transporter ATP-binding protein [Nitrososphaerota archaeon]|nr:ABC transporter ATP-binding protein [Candidatus Calditenuaceae archaeon]MDW8073758.1 ABC transporter ATP-binding protein [Nitrososphaerota archaeon]
MLEVQDLRVYYKSILGDYKSVDGVSLSVNRGEIFGIAGESGCGKSTLVDGVLRLIRPPGYIKSGKVLFEGVDLLSLDESGLNKIRWSKISYIPQGSMNSLNPVLTIEEQATDTLIEHSNLTKNDAKKAIEEKLRVVGLPREVLRSYPHELSGGMRQRVIIAIAIALNPSLVVADEPITALDVVVQKSLLSLLKELRDKYGVTLIFVSHDMAAHAQLVDKLAIMYAGKVVEIASTQDIFYNPLHPYTKLLIASIPRLEKKEIKGIPGIAPSPLNWPKGCRFHTRCPWAMEVCSTIEPEMLKVNGGRMVACHLYQNGGEKY